MQSLRLPSSSQPPLDQLFCVWFERLLEHGKISSSTWLSVAPFVRRSLGFVQQLVGYVQYVRTVARVGRDKGIVELHDALERSVVDFGTGLEQHVRAMDAFGADCVDS